MRADVFMPVFVRLSYHFYVCLCVYVGVRPSVLSFLVCVCVYVCMSVFVRLTYHFCVYA